MSLKLIRTRLAEYRMASVLLASSGMTVASRRIAIVRRDQFVADAPTYVSQLVNAVDALIAATDGEECSDPDSCGSSNQGFTCSRCRLRMMSVAS